MNILITPRRYLNFNHQEIFIFLINWHNTILFVALLQFISIRFKRKKKNANSLSP